MNHDSRDMVFYGKKLRPHHNPKWPAHQIPLSTMEIQEFNMITDDPQLYSIKAQTI